MSNSKELELNNLPDELEDIIHPEIRWYSKFKTIKRKFVWTILDYKSVFKIDQETTTIESPQFSATKGTCKWFFKMYLSNSSISVYLQTDTVPTLKGLKGIECKCVLINSENQDSLYSIQNKHLFKDENRYYYIGKIVELSDLLKNEDKLLPQNKLTINCEVTFYKQEHAMDDCQKNSVIPLEMKETSLQDFEKLFINGEYSDITIHVNGKEYPAHKSILAGRSRVFAAMLKHDMKENQMNRIDVNDIEDENVFVEALRFIYTGKAQNLETMAFELLPVADRYDLEKLKTLCGNALSKKLSVGTVVKILVLADMHSVENLKKQAINYMRAHSVDVISEVDSGAWNDLMARPLLMKEVFLACLK